MVVDALDMLSDAFRCCLHCLNVLNVFQWCYSFLGLQALKTKRKKTTSGSAEGAKPLVLIDPEREERKGTSMIAQNFELAGMSQAGTEIWAN